MRWKRLGTLPRFLLFVYRSFLQNRGLENAKSLTYTSLFAVVPLLTLTFSILSAFPSFRVFGAQIQDMIYERLLPSTSSQLEGYLTSFAGQARNLTWVGAVMLFVTAYLMLVNIERNFNRIWGVSQLRTGLTSFLLYWSVLSLGPLLLGMGFAMSSYITSLSLFERFTEIAGLQGAGQLTLRIFPMLLTTMAFTLLYVAVPNCGVKVRHGLIGALVVALTFIVVKWVFTRFIASASYELVYGTFAAVPIFLMWLYVCWVIILFGANLVRAIPVFRGRVSEQSIHPLFLLLAFLHKCWEKQQDGARLHISELLDEHWPLGGTSPEELVSLLANNNILHSLGHDEYMLSRDLQAVPLCELLAIAPWPLPDEAELQKPFPDVLAGHLPAAEQLRAKFRSVNGRIGDEFSESVGEYFRSGQARGAS